MLRDIRHPGIYETVRGVARKKITWMTDQEEKINKEVVNTKKRGFKKLRENKQRPEKGKRTYVINDSNRHEGFAVTYSAGGEGRG